MEKFSIKLGQDKDLVRLYSYPNKPETTELLTDTILYWFKQTLHRDGFAVQGASAAVRIEGSDFFLDLQGPSEMKLYEERLLAFLSHGLKALEVIEELKKSTVKPGWPDWLQPPAEDKLWDPQNTGKWRFFLPYGMSMINLKSLNFFHYPPMRLLDQMRDYLDDPVPVRVIELLEANGVADEEEALLHSTVMDGAPIAAPDDQGTFYYPGGYNPKIPPVHLIPIDYFHDYQKAMVKVLLNASPSNEKYTIPIVVYGAPARRVFSEIYNLDLGKKNFDPLDTLSTEIIPGKQTAVIGSGHPYAFYMQVQAEIGSGSIVPYKWDKAVKAMKTDLIIQGWKVRMFKDPEQDPKDVLSDCEKYWNADEQKIKVYTLVLHQGSLFYPDPQSLVFTYKLSMEEAEKQAGDIDNY